jgi:hypothetical protein
MATYAELHQELAKALAAAQSDLASVERRIARDRFKYGRAYDRPGYRALLEGRIAELELNLEAIDYEHAAQCTADDPTLRP